MPKTKRTTKTKAQIEKENLELKKQLESYEDLRQADEEEGESDDELSSLFSRPDDVHDISDSDIPDDDIFDLIWRDSVKKGYSPVFTIRHNGAVAGTKRGKYTLDSLQKDYPEGGHFIVTARNASDGRILKRMAFDVAGKHTEDNEEHESKPSGINDFMQLFTVANQLSEKNDIKSTEAHRASVESQNQMTMMIMQMMNQSSQQMQQQLQLQQTAQQQQFKATTEMIKQMNDMQVKFMERMTTQVNEVKNKKEDITPFKLMEMINSAKKDGFEQMVMLQEMAKEMASEMGGDSGKKDSVTDSLIKNFLPVVAKKMSESNYTQQSPQVNPQTGAPRAQAPKAPPPAHGYRSERKPNFNLNGQRFMDKPKKPTTDDTSPPIPPVDPKTNNTKQKIQDLVLGDIGDALLNARKAKDTAILTVNKVVKSGIGHAEILDNFTETDILEIANDLGIPAQANDWLKEYYGEVKKLCTPNISSDAKTVTITRESNISRSSKPSTQSVQPEII